MNMSRSRTLALLKAEVLVVLCVCCGFPPPAAAAKRARYDIPDLWTPDLNVLRRYEKRVSGVLGPDMAARLRIVKSKKRYGLIYPRRGGESAARVVALKHSRILLSRGLRSASPVKSRDWSFLPRPHRKKVPKIKPWRPPPKKLKSRARYREGIERRIESFIKELRQQGRIASNERTAWSVYDFKLKRKLVDINEDLPMQGASMLKPFFALAFFHQVKAGKLKYGRKSRRKLEAMFQKSSNPASNWVLRHAGGPAVAQKLLKKHYGGILRQIRIVEYIPWSGRTYRNLASAHDYSRFLYALWKNELPFSKEMKRLMALPNRDRIFTGASKIPKGTRVYNKTGSTRRFCGDMGILEVRGRNGRTYSYTLIGLIDKERPARNYSRWINARGDVIREVSNMVYEEIMRRHR